MRTCQLVILVGEQGCDLGQGGRRGGVLGMDRVDAEVPSFSQISSQVTQQEPAPAPVPEPTPAPAPQTPQESFFQAVEFDPFSTATQQKAAPAPEQPKAAPAKKDPFDDLMEMFNRRK